MSKVTRIIFENYKDFIGKKVEVEICCYAYGLAYPDNNILLGMDDERYYFLSDKGTDDEQKWDWQSKNDEGKEGCSINVWDYEEYKLYYEKK